ncbi:MAG: hypothetical protein ACEQSE_06255 [Candidatus Aquirickettsiella gammari]
MAQRNATRSLNADNTSGSFTPAARSEWRNDHADSMSARNTIDSTSDAGYTTAGLFLAPEILINFLYFGGSPYMNG